MTVPQRPHNAPELNLPLFATLAQWVVDQAALAEDSYERENYARAHPDQDQLVWHQNVWTTSVIDYSDYNRECGTACCMAGYIALTDPLVDTRKTRVYGGGMVYYKDGSQDAFIPYGADRLGLLPDEADSLFYEIDDVDIVLAHLTRLTGEDYSQLRPSTRTTINDNRKDDAT